MKVFLISIICALTGYAVGGAVSWPGAIPLSASLVKTIVPGETKISSYSTSQYLNAVPTQYAFSAHPQVTYQVPQVNSLASNPAGYYSIGQPAYIPTTNVFYPSQPSFVPGFGATYIPGIAVSPAFPQAPSIPSSPAPINPPSSSPQPDQAPGDADSAVIESAEFGRDQQKQQSSESSPPESSQSTEQQSSQTTAPQLGPSNTFPNFPSIPQIPQQPQGSAPSFPLFPQFPQIPQLPQKPSDGSVNFPPFPQFPQEIGQLPSIPSFPQAPGFPQNTQTPSQLPPTSFPAPTNDDKGLNDEDTVSVESA